MITKVQFYFLLVIIIEGHSRHISCCAALPDGRIVSGSYDKTLKVWNTFTAGARRSTGKCELTLNGHTDWVRCCAVLPDGRIISGSDDCTLKLWNTKSGKCELTFQFHDYCWIKYCGVLSNDPSGCFAEQIVSGSGDSLKLWNLNSCDKSLKVVSKPEKCIRLKIDNENINFCTIIFDKIVSCTNDNILKIWNMQTGECEMILRGHIDRISYCAVLSSERIFSVSYNGTVKVWNVTTGKCEETLEGDSAYVSGCTVLPDGRIVYGAWNGIKIWNLQTKKCELTFVGHIANLSRCIVLPDGRLVSCSEDGMLKIWS
jgi:WD40 repeat protein